MKDLLKPLGFLFPTFIKSIHKYIRYKKKIAFFYTLIADKDYTGMVGAVHAQESRKTKRFYKVWVKKTDSKTRLIGAISGMVTGVFLGLMGGDDTCPPNKICLFQTTAGEKAMAGAVTLGVFGGIVGVVIGLLQIKIPIIGSTEKFKANKLRLKGYSYKGFYSSKP